MPGYKAHQTAGICLVLLVWIINSQLGFFTFPPFSLFDLIAITLIVLFYSILADIDIGTSLSRKLVLGGALGLIIYCFMTNLPLIGIMIAVLLLLMIWMLNHRGRTHTTLAVLVFAVPLIYINWVYAFWGAIAYLSHLLLDKKIKLK